MNTADQRGAGDPVATPDWQHLYCRARERNRRLALRVEYLAADNDRLNRLLACTLTIACCVNGDERVDEGAMLQVVAAITGDDLARAAKFT